MQTDTTTHTSRAIIGASPQLTALFVALDQADTASEVYERDVHDPHLSHLRDRDPRPAAFEASFAECNRLCDVVTAACDAIAAFPATTVADLHAKTQRLLALEYFEVDGTAEQIAADIARIAGEA